VVTIAPAPSLFGRVLTLSPNFQSYIVKKVSYKILPRFNLQSLPGDLPLSLKVSLTSSDEPSATVQDYANFANVSINIVDKPLTGSGIPYSAVNQTNSAAFRRLNKFAINNVSLNTPHYLHSVLFSSSVIANFYLIQTIHVQFFNFDG